jgi:hypothetical protein
VGIRVAHGVLNPTYNTVLTRVTITKAFISIQVSTLKMLSNDPTPSSPFPASSKTQVSHLFFVLGFVIKLPFQPSLEKEARFLIMLGTNAKWSMENQLAQCKAQMKVVQHRLDRVTGDLDVVVAAAKAKGIDTTPHTQQKCVLLRSSLAVGHRW